MLRNLLVYRLILLNACVAAFLVWSWSAGLLQKLFAAETTGIGYGLVLLTVVGLIGCFHRAFKVSKAFDSIKNKTWVDTTKFKVKNSYVGQISVYLMMFGLLGNILGFLLAVYLVDFSGGTESILTTITSMYGGVKVAFANSLIGTALGLLIRVNYQFLSTATSLLAMDALSLGREKGLYHRV